MMGWWAERKKKKDTFDNLFRLKELGSS